MRVAQVRVYELSQLALKFERHLLSEARPVDWAHHPPPPITLTGAPPPAPLRWWTSKS
jgi:hypothetical protein